jgi:UDP-glucose 4-epimerase
MKVAVTGASGYLGGLILRRIAADPEVDFILGLDVNKPEFASPKLNFEKADVRTADFESIFRGFDAVYHLAFIVQPPAKTPMRVVDEINIEGSRRVFEGAVGAGVPKIICAGSTAAYGAHPDNPAVLIEDSPLRPNAEWYYSRAKGKVEAALDALQQRHPRTVIIRLRPCIFLGPGVNNSMGDMFSAGILFCFDERVRIDFCWDEDVADAFHLALRHGKSDIFNLAADGPLTIPDMGRLSGKQVVHLHHAHAVSVFKMARALGIYSAGDVEWISIAPTSSINVSSEKAKKSLGWRHRYAAAGAYTAFLKRRGRTPLLKSFLRPKKAIR